MQIELLLQVFTGKKHLKIFLLPRSCTYKCKLWSEKMLLNNGFDAHKAEVVGLPKYANAAPSQFGVHKTVSYN